MSVQTHALRSALVAVVALTTLATGSLAQPSTSIPAPEAFFGFAMGTAERLADWTQIVEYFRLVDERSPRVVVEELGRTTGDRPYLAAVISSADTIDDLPAYRAMQHRLADPRRTAQADAERIARDGKAVVLIGTNVHGTEIGNSQMVNELLYRMATRDDEWMRHVLDNVILVLVPSQNPDGQQMVVDWYRRNLGTRYEGSPLPDLYHAYVGHDNNRDSYMLTQVETQLLAKLIYQEWLPEVYLDKHQMGNSRARIFVPPFADPPNPNIDPLVWSQVNLLGQSMATALFEAGKTGVVWGELYSGFWQGANSTNPWWHNMVALLTEVASADLATSVVQERAGPPVAPFARPRAGVRRDSDPPVPAPVDVQPRMNYLEPWTGGTWTLADVVEYELLATLGLLEGAANNRAMLKRNFYAMNRRTIERFAAGRPFAFIVPSSQRDPIAAAHLIRLVQAEAAEVHRANESFRADGIGYPAGSHVIRLDQPFGRWVKDLLEAQTYPDDGPLRTSGGMDRPYDITAWTLGMLMGVQVIQVERPFDARLTRLDEAAAPPPGRLAGRGNVFVLDHAVNQSFVATNRLLAEGADVAWASEDVSVNGHALPAGAVVVHGVGRDRMRALAAELDLQIQATNAIDAPTLPLVAPRVAVYEPWGGNMDAGWTRWVLDQHAFPYTHVRPGDLRQAGLIRRFDTIVLPEMTISSLVQGLQATNVRPEYRGGIGEAGVRHLTEFVQAGGTIVTLGDSARFAIAHLNVPVRDVLRGLDEDTFFGPGSLLKIQVDATHPVAYGMPDTADAMFVANGGYAVLDDSSAAAVGIVARYPTEPLLRSGLLVGDRALRGSAAVLDVAMGRGRVIMLTFRAQHRGQTWGTFRLLFNALLYGPAMAARPTSETLDAAWNQP